MTEIERAMVRVGASKELFRLQTLTPIYPPYKLRLTDPTYYDDKEWNFNQDLKDEKTINKELEITMKELCASDSYKKEEVHE